MKSGITKMHGTREVKGNIIQYLSGLLFLMLPLLGFSQQNKEEGTLLQQITIAEKSQLLQTSTDISGVLIRQHGIENQAFVQQVGWTNALLQQTGASNVIFLNQSGYNSQHTIAQIGNQNQYHGLVSGDGINASILQQGDNNNIDQNILGSELIFGIIQEGSHNDINHHSDGLSSPSLKIYQRGNDMRIIINSKN